MFCANSRCKSYFNPVQLVASLSWAGLRACALSSQSILSQSPGRVAGNPWLSEEQRQNDAVNPKWLSSHKSEQETSSSERYHDGTHLTGSSYCCPKQGGFPLSGTLVSMWSKQALSCSCDWNQPGLSESSSSSSWGWSVALQARRLMSGLLHSATLAKG